MDIMIPRWIQDEFSAIDFGDKRLVNRFKYIMTQFMKKAQSNISSKFDDWASVKGCYRFFQNDKAKASVMLREHISKTKKRIDNETTKTLILHDTTFFDYNNREKALDLDKVFRGKAGKGGSLGLILHNSLAVNEQGESLGLVYQAFISRK